METFSALLAICAGNSPVPGEFPTQRPVRQSFDVFFDLCLKKWLSKQSWGWWLETLSHPLWRHCNCISWFFFSGECDGEQPVTLDMVCLWSLHTHPMITLPPILALWYRTPKNLKKISSFSSFCLGTLLLCMMSLKIILLKLLPHLPGANEWKPDQEPVALQWQDADTTKLANHSPAFLVKCYEAMGEKTWVRHQAKF